MSMPLPIHVVLTGNTKSKVKSAQKFFRLSTPGIGAPYYCAIDTTSEGKILPPSRIPRNTIDFWLCLDLESFSTAKKIHSQDISSSKYDRGFYKIHLPEACILLEYDSEKQKNILLKEWDKKVTEAWISTG